MSIFSRSKKSDDKKPVEPTAKVETAVEKEAPKVIEKPTKENTGDAYRVLLKPLVTEKSASLNALGQYVFAVSLRATKSEIKKAIWHVYGVKPVAVNVSHSQGKYIQGRILGQRKDWKKAIITLKTGDSIQIYEGV